MLSPTEFTRVPALADGYFGRCVFACPRQSPPGINLDLFSIGRCDQFVGAAPDTPRLTRRDHVVMADRDATEVVHGAALD